MLENVACIELLRRGYRISVGRIGNLKIDFVAERDGKKTYIQVAYLLPSKTTLVREATPLLAVKDNYPKLLLTLDREIGNDYEGVLRLYLPDWLDDGDNVRIPYPYGENHK